jgi:hypothetical protein
MGPISQCGLQSVFDDAPLPTPSRCPTEDTLLNVASQLEALLAKEQQALEAGKRPPATSWHGCNTRP